MCSKGDIKVAGIKYLRAFLSVLGGVDRVVKQYRHMGYIVH